LVNDPFDDPGLFVPFSFQRRAVLFDLGDLTALSPQDILKLSHIFVTHTHMDHFSGFDRLLRLMIGRDKTLHLYGPRGFLKNVEGKLAGYSWNLVERYTDSLVLAVAEIHRNSLLRRQYACRNRFEAQGEPVVQSFDGRLLEERDLTITAAELDHGIPCLAFALEEPFHINIRPDGLSALKLRPGPWLQAFKQSVYDNLEPTTTIAAQGLEKGETAIFQLGELKARIAKLTPGQKVSYVADAAYSDSNIDKIVDLAHRSDHLFIEAAFLDVDRDTAGIKNHLTARQAGSLAGWAQVKQITPFHFSPRYSGQARLLESEARQAFADCFGATAGTAGTTVFRKNDTSGADKKNSRDLADRPKLD
jgi:ribonuclease Z